MTTFRIKVPITGYQIYQVEAESLDEAKEQITEGNQDSLLDSIDPSYNINDYVHVDEDDTEIAEEESTDEDDQVPA